MKLASYWHDTAPRFGSARSDAVAGDYDVAVIGAGFTGLSAARRLALAGQRVALLEALHVGAGASGRNGGHLNNGIAHGYADAKSHLGAERAHALYKAYDRSIDMIEDVIAEDRIDCDFHRSGKLKLASKPSHLDKLHANYELVRREVDPDARWLDRGALRGELHSDAFHGAILFPKSAMMHMGKYVFALAEAAVRHGAHIWESAPVTGRTRQAGKWELTTPRGRLTAGRVIAATGAYSAQIPGAPLRYFQRRIIPVGSYIVATRSLSADEIAATLPGNRTCVTSLNIGNYFRLSPDNRLIFGGRARFSAVSNPETDRASGVILRAALARTFPQLAGVDIDYCWGGLVGLTADRFPRAGEADGLIYGMGYSGHGAQLSTLIGCMLADIAMDRPADNPLAGLDWSAVPSHSGKPWFLPLIGLWFGLKDRMS
jgi:glycine/D-amino acid oxidase-like deaminating enzyme